MDGSDAYCIYIVNSKGAPLFHRGIFPVLHHYSFGVPFLSPIVIWLKKKKTSKNMMIKSLSNAWRPWGICEGPAVPHTGKRVGILA